MVCNTNPSPSLASNSGIPPIADAKIGAGNGTRTRDPKLGRLALYQLSYSRSQKWWRGKDSNLRRHRRQIYSLLPLATREPLLVSLHPIFKKLIRKPGFRRHARCSMELAIGLEPTTCRLQ